MFSALFALLGAVAAICGFAFARRHMKKTLIFAAMGVAAVAGAQTAVFDGISGVDALSFGIPSGVHILEGQAFNLGNTGSGPVTITGLDIAVVNLGAGTTFSDVTLQMTFFNTYTPNPSSTALAFSHPIASLTHDFGATNFGTDPLVTIGGNGFSSANGATPGIDLSSAGITFSGSQNLGVQFIWRVDTGSGLQTNSGFTTAVRGGAGDPAPAVGSLAAGIAPNFGFFKSSDPSVTSTDNSVAIGDLRSFGDNSTLAFRLYTAAAVPEPGTWVALGLGVLAFARRRRRN